MSVYVLLYLLSGLLKLINKYVKIITQSNNEFDAYKKSLRYRSQMLLKSYIK